MRIKRIPQMNRLYILGDVQPIRPLLSDINARHDERGYWVPLRMETQLRAALAKEAEYAAKIAADLAAWQSAIEIIPADYRLRHGSMYGGVVSIDGEQMSEPGITAPRLPWERLATHQTRVRDLTGTSSINGRVQDEEDLYRAITSDGRPIYRIASSRGFGDDLRETYYLPEDLWQRMLLAEISARGITRESAQQWLAQYRGCVGTELYEFAATVAPAPHTLR
jgi:hypothetical protein